MRKNRIAQILLVFMVVFSIAMVPGGVNALAGTGTVESPYDVEKGIASQNQSSKTVQGIVVGQPTATTTVLKTGFTNDYTLALAMVANETNVAKMIYVQIPSTYRSAFGLKTNPTLMGKTVVVTGNLSAYYSHAGITTVSNMKLGTGGGTTPPVPGTTSPYDATYYKSAIGLSGPTLKTTLHNIIDDHTKLSYDQVWDALRYTDKDPTNGNNVILLYTGRSQSNLTNGGNSNDWNREHVWAKSHGDFGTTAGAGTDLHHLRPTDVSVNADRGNLDFDNGGVYHTEATQCKYDADSWEPRNSVKGDIARMLFYMAVRYEGDMGEVNLELNDAVNNGSAPYMGRLSVLLTWHKLDPVDTFEMNRNNIIYNSYQHNRNPFIDHPEWVGAIWN